MGDDDLLIHKDKLKMVVQPLLHDGSSVSEVCENKLNYSVTSFR